MSAAEKMRNYLNGELETIEQKIANFDMAHDGINEFIHKNEHLRYLKQRRQGIINALQTL